MTTGLRYANAAAASDKNVSRTLDDFSSELDNFSGTFDDSTRCHFESGCSPKIGEVFVEDGNGDEPPVMMPELGSSLDEFDAFS